MLRKIATLSIATLLASTSAHAGGSHEGYNSTTSTGGTTTSYAQHEHHVFGHGVRPYLGIDLGVADTNVSAGFEDNYQMGSIYGGLNFSDYLGVEIGYTNSLSENGQIAGSDSNLEGYYADLLGYIPVTDARDVKIVGLVGYGTYDFNTSPTFAGDSDEALRYGAGLQYEMNEDWAIRGLWRRIEFDTTFLDEANTFTAGLSYKF